MKSRFAALATLALLAAVSPAIADPNPPTAPKEAEKKAEAPSVKPEEYAKTLLGTWRQEMTEGEVKGHAITTYLENGKAESTANLEVSGEKLTITAKAKWILEKDKLTVEITESSMPDALPPGTKIEQTIVSLSDKEFRYIQGDKEITEKRVKEGKPKAAPAK